MTLLTYLKTPQGMVDILASTLSLLAVLTSALDSFITYLPRISSIINTPDFFLQALPHLFWGSMITVMGVFSLVVMVFKVTRGSHFWPRIIGTIYALGIILILCPISLLHFYSFMDCRVVKQKSYMILDGCGGYSYEMLLTCVLCGLYGYIAVQGFLEPSREKILESVGVGVAGGDGGGVGVAGEVKKNEEEGVNNVEGTASVGDVQND